MSPDLESKPHGCTQYGKGYVWLETWRENMGTRQQLDKHNWTIDYRYHNWTIDTIDSIDYRYL